MDPYLFQNAGSGFVKGKNGSESLLFSKYQHRLLSSWKKIIPFLVLGQNLFMNVRSKPCSKLLKAQWLVMDRVLDLYLHVWSPWIWIRTYGSPQIRIWIQSSFMITFLTLKTPVFGEKKIKPRIQILKYFKPQILIRLRWMWIRNPGYGTLIQSIWFVWLGDSMQRRGGGAEACQIWGLHYLLQDHLAGQERLLPQGTHPSNLFMSCR